MYKVNIEEKKLIKLEPTTYSELGLKERFDIQEWIEKQPEILGEELLVIGKEVILSSGKRLDLLCVDKNANLVIVELKRDDTGSSVDWQAIKYASYCSSLLTDDVFSQYADYLNESEYEAQKKIEEFIDSDIENLNIKQRIIIASKDFHSEVISAILWLRDFGVDIQCTRLSPFLDKNNDLFLKPEIIIPLPEAKDYIEKKVTKNRVQASQNIEWSGYYFVNVGEGTHRTWNDNRKYSFLGAGQGERYSKALKRLKVGDKVYAYMKGCGYVGFGIVNQQSVMIKDFLIDNKRLIDCELEAELPTKNMESEEFSEYAVGVEWKKTVDAKTFSGVFANQNVVCKLRNEQTLKFLKAELGE